MDSLQELKTASQRKGSFLKTMGAVLWSFFGVRKGSAHDEDISQLNPVHVVIVGVLAGLGFVLGLLLVVRLVVSGA